MLFQPTAIAGVVEVTTEPHRDERGSFARTYCRSEFAAHGLNAQLAQCSLSENKRAHTVRGFHMQVKPSEEAKLVQCLRGRLFDVALDLRAGSKTYGRHHAAELSAATGKMLYIPEGCAHAFQTLEDDTAIMYYISAEYDPAAGRGVRWNDPALNVAWPHEASVVNERDLALPLFAEFKPGA